MPEPTVQELAPIFYEYGLAVFNCHLLEECIDLLLRVIDEERHRQGLSLRPIPIDSRSTKTIGVLFTEVLAVEYFTDTERRLIQKAIQTRNLLVHAYWDKRVMQATLTPAGRAWLVDDLDKKKVQLRDADRLVTKFVNDYFAKYGETVESLSANSFNEYVNDEGPPDEVLH